MRVLVAPQEFKGTLTAVEAARVIAGAVRDALPSAEVDVIPMADGGPGTAAALLAAMGGEWMQTTAHDPLMRPIQASWAKLASGTAVVECASASGLLLLEPQELDPRRTSTFGTGDLIAAALDGGCREIIVGLGGSATNDGGAGMAQALGFRLLDASGRDIQPGGAALARLDRIDASAAHRALSTAAFVAATDVINPLCGPEGASAVYGPQKGAGAAVIAELDAALAHFAALLERDLGVWVLQIPGGGAAGGLGAGCAAFLSAEFRSGAAVVAEAAGLALRVRDCDLVITGEGRLDGQTRFGKAPAYVARAAKAAGKRVVCLPGTLGPGHERSADQFDLVEPLAAGKDLPAKSLAAATRRALQRLGLSRA